MLERSNGFRNPLQWVAMAGLVLLTACAGSPEVPIRNSATVAADAPAVREAVRSEMQSLGFKVSEAADGTLSASGSVSPNPGYADCPIVRVAWENGQDQTRYRQAQLIEQLVELSAGFQAADGSTLITVDPTFTGVYANRVSGGGLNRTCSSNGRLEQALIGAAMGTGSSQV